MSSPEVFSRGPNPLRLTASRRDAQKSTGPRTDVHSKIGTKEISGASPTWNGDSGFPGLPTSPGAQDRKKDLAGSIYYTATKTNPIKPIESKS